jgi:hypothetical protein
MTNVKSVKKLNLRGKFTNTYILTRLDDKEICVPHAEDNMDYQEILLWLEEDEINNKLEEYNGD